MRNLKNQAITLISLVITIIVLLLLAGVAIATLTGDNGILRKSNEASEENRKQTASELLNLKITNTQMQTYAKEQRMPTLKELAIALDPGTDKDVKSVSKTRQKVSSLDWINDTDYQSIFTILKDYPEYEFEIDSSLKLASINGVKIANKDTITVDKTEYEQLKNDVAQLKASYQLENATPKLVATIDKTFGSVSENHTIESFPIDIPEDSKNLLEYNPSDKAIVIKESGFYILNLFVSANRPGNCYGDARVICKLNDVDFIESYAYSWDGSGGSDSNSMCLYLTKNQSISLFSSTTVLGSTSGASSTIRMKILKMSQ